MRKHRDTSITLVPFRDLPAAFAGWRFRGNELVSPDGDRVSVERLRGLLWRDAMELRRAGYASRRAAEKNRRSPQYGAKVKVVIVDIADLRIRGQSSA